MITMSEQRHRKRRLPSGQACIGCRSRKHRCDGARPTCGSCQSRLVACQYPRAGRVADERLRAGSASASPHIQGEGESERQRGLSVNLSDRQQYQLPQPHPRSLSSTLTPGPGREGLDLLRRASNGMLRGSVGNVPSEEAQPHLSKDAEFSLTRDPQDGGSIASSPSDSGGPDGFFGDSSTFAFVSEVPPESQHGNGVHLQNNRRLGESIDISVQGPASTCHTSAGKDPRYVLPEKSLADNLLDAYFDRVYPLYPFVHEGTFRTTYERIGTDSTHSTFPLSWYAVLNMIFASSCEFCDAIPETEVTNTVTPFVARSRKIIFSLVFKSGNLDLVQALLLMCHYLQGTMELNECWNLAGLMIRTAVSIGLHLTPERLPITMVEKEVRKRVWWGCFVLDRTLSWKFGRPTSIQATNALDLPLPLAVDDQYIHNDSLAPRQPAARPPIAAFFLHTVKLAQVIDRILQVLYTTNREKLQQTGADKSGISHILGEAVILDGELQAWWDDRPLHLRPQSGIADGQIFQRQQTVMRLRYLQIRILLQRQLLLMFSRRDIDDHFLCAIAIAGSQTCISAARETICLIYAQYRHGLLNSLCYNLHYIFTSMGVLLHLYSMEKSKLNLLGYRQKDETLECGMEFLKAASTTNTLAARYVTMLQGLRGKTRQNSVPSNLEQREDLVITPPTTNDLIMSESSATSGMQQWRLSELHNERGELDLDGMNFDDLLFGTGLPQDIISFEYPLDGFLV